MSAFATAFATKRSTLLLVGIAMAGISAAVPSTAVTLGNVTSQTGLGQSLRLEIPVTIGGDEVVSASCLRLLTDGGRGDTPQLVTGRVSFERGAPNSRILVTTARPINEPALRVSVQSGCGNTTRRDYVLLFDPPAVGDVPPALTLAVDAGTSTAPAAPPPTIVGAQTRSVSPDSPHSASVHKRALAQTAVTPAHVDRTAQAPSAPASANPPAQAQPAPAIVAAVAATQERMIIEQPASTPTTAPVTHPATTQTPVLRISTATTRGGSSGGFISTAAAQPLQPVASARIDQPSPALERLWPYAAVTLCLAGLGMCALAVRKQRVPPSPTWMGAANAGSKTPGDTHADLNTFAHFSEMTEPAQSAPRDVAEKRDTRSVPVASNGELDTLLEEDDVINEKTIRDEWAAVASEHAIDIGTDSILQAIATAEREMRIAAPPPAQVAMDQALDDELLQKPKKR